MLKNVYFRGGILKLNSHLKNDFNENISLFLDNVSKNNDNIKVFDNYVEDVYVDPNKKTILIIDDNEGICSFLKDDFYEILGNDYNQYNILIFTSSMAAYIALNFLEKTNLTVDYAIIDILLNGVFKTDVKNIRLTGVDVLEYLYKKYNLKNYIFYTGNQLNPDVKLIGNILDTYNNFCDEEIESHTIYKTGVSIEERRELIKQKFFQGK